MDYQTPISDEFPGDEIGVWSELKLEIIRRYALEYSRILTANKLHHVYVDAFAGAGVHKSKTTGAMIPGSPINALSISPPFKEFHLIDLKSNKLQQLRSMVGSRTDVHIHEGDCNKVMRDLVFPTMKRETYRRCLCLLDPYGLHLDWEVIETAGKLGTVEIFLNFPTADMNRNVLWRNVDGVSENQVDRMTRFWGDDSWRKAAYTSDGMLFENMEQKVSNDEIATAFRSRLKEVAGFQFVPQPVPMRNTKGAIVYYLFFASPNATGNRIVSHIFNSHRARKS